LADECGHYGTLIQVLAYCGLRWGEAAALRVENVDLMRRRIQVVESVTEIGGRLELGTRKSHQARSVPIPSFLADELMLQTAGRRPETLVFSSPQDTVIRLSNWRKRCFDKAAAKAGLARLTPHELRHTAASLAISSGANVKTVQRMLGHASAAMTLNRYGHLMDDDLDVVAEKLSAAHERVVPSGAPNPSDCPSHPV
jgi:integrase